MHWSIGLESRPTLNGRLETSKRGLRAHMGAWLVQGTGITVSHGYITAISSLSNIQVAGLTLLLAKGISPGERGRLNFRNTAGVVRGSNNLTLGVLAVKLSSSKDTTDIALLRDVHRLGMAMHTGIEAFVSEFIGHHVAIAEHVLGWKMSTYLAHVSHHLTSGMSYRAILNSVLLVESLVRRPIVVSVYPTCDVFEHLVIGTFL